MRHILIVLMTFFISNLFAQKDTIVVTDYTSVFVEIEPDGLILPITSLDKTDQAGFFLRKFEKGELRICNDESVSVWINGQLLRLIDSCDFISVEELDKMATSDTLYVTLSSKSSLANLACDHVIFEEFKVIREEISIPRNVRSAHREFIIIGFIILTILFGLMVSRYGSRMSYLVEKTFTFKLSAYEFVNTNFFSAANIYLAVTYSFTISFALLYVDSFFSYGLLKGEILLSHILFIWVRNSLLIFVILLSKWILVSIIAKLFKFRELKNYQLFDFINFQFFLSVPILLFLLVDFILNNKSDSWMWEGFIFTFPLTLILFIIWFTLKFVNNSPRKKLMIISYLCATEIVPVIILLGWFFK